MVYATYGYYKNEYRGEIVPDKIYPRMIAKASQYIDHFTFGRITEENRDTFSSLPSCACEMAEAIYKMQGANGDKKEIKSESTDGYSVTYATECADGEIAENTLKKKLYSIASVYLMSTGLLYLGC